MVILEFSEEVVAKGWAPAQLCQILSLKHNSKRYIELADKVYVVYTEGLTARIIKDRFGVAQDFILSGEDAVALSLKAVVL